MTKTNVLDVPLFENSPEDVHCVQAVLQMILKYYFPGRLYTLEYLDKVTHHFPGGWTWDTAVFQFLLTLGFEIKVFSRFDFEAFAVGGVRYLEKMWDAETLRLQSINADLVFEQSLARDFWLTPHPNFSYTKRCASKEDFEKMFSDGFLLAPSVNAYALENEEGFCSHYILITGLTKEQVIFNDVDPPATKNACVSWEQFEHARPAYSTLFGVRLVGSTS